MHLFCISREVDIPATSCVYMLVRRKQKKPRSSIKREEKNNIKNISII
jgi:hypothetical protein